MKQQPIATVINNNQDGWKNIIETAPNVTLDIGTKLYAEPLDLPAVYQAAVARTEVVETSSALAEMEEHTLRLLDEIDEDGEVSADKRWLSIGRTQIQLGFMAVKRSIFKPERVEIAELDRPIVETGWVIERADSPVSAPLYYAPRQAGEQWSADPQQALRFAREEDVLNFVRTLPEPLTVRIAEHQWS